MTNNTVIYNTVEGTGMCTKEHFVHMKLPIGVHTEIELSRAQLKELFERYDEDHIRGTNLFGGALLHYMHTKLLDGVNSDVRLPLADKE